MDVKKDDMVWALAFQRGDTEAFNQVYRLHYRELFLFAFRLTGDELEAEDIATESLVKLWERHQDFDHPLPVKAFLYTATRNASLNYLKKSQRQSDSKAVLLANTDEAEEQIFSYMVYAELLQQVYREIERMPPKPRKVFELSFFEGLSNAEIAERLAISPGKVKNNKSRALRHLRGVFGKDLLPGLLFFLSAWRGF